MTDKKENSLTDLLRELALSQMRESDLLKEISTLRQERDGYRRLASDNYADVESYAEEFKKSEEAVVQLQSEVSLYEFKVSELESKVQMKDEEIDLCKEREKKKQDEINNYKDNKRTSMFDPFTHYLTYWRKDLSLRILWKI